jgi:hypothetical protein
MNILIVLGVVILVLVVGVIFILPLLKAMEENETVEEKLPFQLKKYFFTKSEQEFFRLLEQQIDHARFTIFPKVRLADFVETTADKEEWQANWNKIKSKHVDFLVYDIIKGSIAVAIELDGNSHTSERAQKNDDFKNRLYLTLGLELVRVKVGSDFNSEVSAILQKIIV